MVAALDKARRQSLKRRLLQVKLLREAGIGCDDLEKEILSQINLFGYKLGDIQDEKINWGHVGNPFYRMPE